MCVVVSLERMRAIREIDAAASTMTVEAGVVMEAAQRAADAADLFFPLDLGGRGSCHGNLHLSVGMAGHTVPELDIEEVVYAAASRRRGSISAEHGIGSLKGQFLHLSRSAEEIALMRTLKNAIDPHGILNPGKIFPPEPDRLTRADATR